MNKNLKLEPKRRQRSAAGHTVLELILSLTLAILLLSSLFSLYYGAAKAAAADESKSTANQEIRMATKRLARDFRLVGLMATQDVNGDSNDINRDVSGLAWSDSARDDFEYASTYEIVFTSDYDSDGNTETIRYYLNNGRILQESWEWSRDSIQWMMPQTKVVATSVDHLMYRYFDRDGNPIPDYVPAGNYELNAGERRRITAVEITVVTRSDREQNGNPEFLYLDDGTYWYDNYRRVVQTFMIRGRNLSLGA